MRTRFTGKADGSRVHPVDEDVPKSRREVDMIMSLAKVSEQDAQWLHRDGYWERYMHMVRTAVIFRHAELEKPDGDVAE